MPGLPITVPYDLADQVKELRAAGENWCRISVATGLPRTTCQHIVKGCHKLFSDELTARQVQSLLASLYSPLFFSAYGYRRYE